MKRIVGASSSYDLIAPLLMSLSIARMTIMMMDLFLTANDRV
jgi:hypothetical protein